MGIPLPTEILLEILHRTDRKTLCNLRVVSKQLCQAVTEVLFRNLNVHYGLDRSITQMKAITSAPPPVIGPPVSACIRNLFLPSESFSPRADKFRFTGPCSFKWSHELPTDHSRLVGEENESGRKFRIIQEHRAVYDGEITENLYNLSVRFDPEIPTFREEIELYESTITEFFEACENLQEITVAVGAGWNTDRIKYWSYMLMNSGFPVIVESIRRLRIFMPRVEVTYAPIVSEYLLTVPEDGKSKTFSSLTSLDIVIHSLRIPIISEAVEEHRVVNSQIKKFLSYTPNITSYSLSTTEFIRDTGDMIFPRFSENTHLTSLSLCTIFIPSGGMYAEFREFREMVESAPSLMSLKIGLVTIELLNPRLVAGNTYDPNRGLPSPIDEDFPSWVFNTPPKTSWTNFFALVLKTLPKLTDYKFRQLTYGRNWSNMWSRAVSVGSSKIVLMAPKDGKYATFTHADFVQETRDIELISPYPSDNLELKAFKKEINRRRACIGLGGGEGSDFGHNKEEEEAEESTSVIGQQEHLVWRFR
ncbi:hypothetical protein TWF730_010339 [Orbilia blumenaviensis]|uniref:F-box domain-containing protein n=1 Tax=Orbilia blumenaviensis TaxID=1796055 RepID=A0AAV9UQH8_9PEZI